MSGSGPVAGAEISGSPVAGAEISAARAGEDVN
jgi:hypothetical protein